jgi:hypothetical protein
MGLVALLAVCLSARAADSIDAGIHLVPVQPLAHRTSSPLVFQDAIEAALAAMDAAGVSRALVLPLAQPAAEGHPVDVEAFAPELSRHADRFAWLGGGGTLNRLIQSAVLEQRGDEEDRRRFRRRAMELIDRGARGFGEIALARFSYGVDGIDRAQFAPADHPAVLELAVIAAERDVPMVVRLEAVPEPMPEPMPMPRSEHLKPELHPETLDENLAAFERLLSGNPHTRFVWMALGVDNTGRRDAALSRRLLNRRPNLYLGVSFHPSADKRTSLLQLGGGLKPPWLNLVQDFPERFLLMSGQYFLPLPGKPIHPLYSRRSPPVMNLAVTKILAALPADLARRVGHENAVRLFKLDAPRSGSKP